MLDGVGKAIGKAYYVSLVVLGVRDSKRISEVQRKEREYSRPVATCLVLSAYGTD